MLWAGVFVGALVGMLDAERVGLWDVSPVFGSALLVAFLAGSAALVPFAFLRTGRTATIALAVLLGVLMAATTVAFGRSESSTAGFVYVYWWILGPVGAVGVLLVQRWPEARRAGSPPAADGPVLGDAGRSRDPGSQR